MSTTEDAGDMLPMEFVNLPEEFQKIGEQSYEPCPHSLCGGNAVLGNASRGTTCYRLWGPGQVQGERAWPNQETHRETKRPQPRPRQTEPPSERSPIDQARAKTCAQTAEVEADILSVDAQSRSDLSSGANGILDTGATKTVIGSQLVKGFLKALGPELRAQVTRGPCNVVFRFGNQGTLMSQHSMIVPLVIAPSDRHCSRPHATAHFQFAHEGSEGIDKHGDIPRSQ